ncbi:hypothetical protein F3157_10950 [Virgibacillus dakarensis]|uniref:Uncharacterized protein n=1 Tax=Lentibacillus populi TaxID=1827502 RepID=A0A9W5TWR9_9BACI|nr:MULTISPECIES: hypothetical protein [Bacillaceae]MBT2215762.1 hypothetical protein [Virgibacillus dakarensis]MTW86173.1 hypothetical protein [Virgibacillus dakarensis]GGB38672.1 hypothetical protein GCM10011409_15220 [Lentibacillus populi]
MEKSQVNKNVESNQKFFSIKNGLWFFLKTNIMLAVMITLFTINRPEWRSDGGDKVTEFIFLFECLFILLSVFACLKPEKNIMKHRVYEKKSKNEWIGMAIAIISTSLLSLFMLPAGIPFPSTVNFVILSINFLVAVYSIVFHKVAIALYELNVFKEKDSVADYTFKYIAILFSGLNYYVQITLQKLPLIFNKPIAIVFVIILAMQLILTGTVFTY